MKPKAISYFVFTVHFLALWGIGMRAAEVGPDEAQLNLGALVRSLQEIEGKDYQLCVETLVGGHFLDKHIEIILTKPATKVGDLKVILDKLGIHFATQGNVVIIQDTDLATLGSGNPLDVAIPRLELTGDVISMVSAFGIGATTMVAATSVDSLPRFSWKHATALTLRDALIEMAALYGAEWTTFAMGPIPATQPSMPVSSAGGRPGNLGYPLGFVRIVLDRSGIHPSRIVTQGEGSSPVLRSSVGSSVGTVGKLIAAVQGLIDKDFYLCVEMREDSRFVERTIDITARPVPRMATEFKRMLEALNIAYAENGRIILIKDDSLASIEGLNPCELTRDGLISYGGPVSVIAAFDVSSRIDVPPQDLGKVSQMSLEMAGKLTLRDSLLEMTRRYHFEWTAKVSSRTRINLPNSGGRNGAAEQGFVLLSFERGPWTEIVPESARDALP